MSDKSKIEIRAVPKLGSTRETMQLLSHIFKEDMGFKKKLAGESARFFLKTTLGGLRRAGKAEGLELDGESSMALPEIALGINRYFGIRYGPPIYKTGRIAGIPTGYTILERNNSILMDKNQSAKIARLYRIWEEIYIRPYKVPKPPTLLNWLIEFENKFYAAIVARRESSYSNFEGTTQEVEALKELDQEVFDPHPARIELLTLERRFWEIQFDLFEHPSDSNIAEFMQMTYRLRELTAMERSYVERRIEVWKRFQALLESEYKVKIDFEFDWGSMGYGAFIDLVKYLLWKNIIPEGVLTATSYNVLKDSMKAKILEMTLNSMVHRGGLVSLEEQSRANKQLSVELDRYVKAWETEVSDDMIRLPDRKGE